MFHVEFWDENENEKESQSNPSTTNNASKKNLLTNKKEKVEEPQAIELVKSENENAEDVPKTIEEQKGYTIRNTRFLGFFLVHICSNVLVHKNHNCMCVCCLFLKGIVETVSLHSENDEKSVEIVVD